MTIMLLGDIHGNSEFFVSKVIPAARQAGVKWIYQLGDFGYWEHQEAGEMFLDQVRRALAENDMNLVFIQGNHDKVSLIPEKYFMLDGFYKVRSNIWYAPNGTVWTPDYMPNTTFIALGGAYSIDKQWRLDEETRLFHHQTPPDWRHIPNRFKETLWFPEEEMSDQDMDDILASVTGKVDVILSHDMPMGVNYPDELLPIPESDLNKRRLAKAVKTLKPKILAHGHLHTYYKGIMRSGDDSDTIVYGLGADVSDFSWDAWTFLSE